MRPFAALLSLLIGASGWYYLFYSKAAHRLAAVEDPVLNGRRIRLRRANGVVMILLAVCFCAGFYSVEWEPPAPAFAAIWAAVAVLLAVVLGLALIDVRLTWRLRTQRIRSNTDPRQRQ